MESHPIQIGEGVIEVPWWWADALLVWLALLGLILLLLGRRLVRPSIGAVGMLVGAGAMLMLWAGWVVAEWPNVHPAAAAIVGAILGGIAGALLWRVGVGVLMAVAVAVLAPSIYLLIQHTELPAYQPVVDNFYVSANLALGVEGGGEAPTESSPEGPIRPQDMLVPMREAAGGLANTSRDWWDLRTNDEKWLLGLTCGGGAALAILIGLALPYFSATLVTSMVGSLMVMGLVYGEVDRLGAKVAGLLPTSLIGFMLLWGSVALVGVLLQWTVFRPRKKPKPEG